MSTTTTITRSTTMIAVSTPGNRHTYEYPDASRWHVDDSGHLHIVAANNGGNVATFQTGMWLHVEKRDKGAMPGVNEAMSQGIAAVADYTEKADRAATIRMVLWNGVVLHANAVLDPKGYRALLKVAADDPMSELFTEYRHDFGHHPRRVNDSEGEH